MGKILYEILHNEQDKAMTSAELKEYLEKIIADLPEQEVNISVDITLCSDSGMSRMIRGFPAFSDTSERIQQFLNKKNMNNKRIYISGAIAHHDINERKAAFAAAAHKLREEGFTPVNPFDNGLPDSEDWRRHMRVDIGMLLQCGRIYMLRGWELSKGAKLELDVASSCGIEVMFETHEP
jgi:hypothetical protein|uniref:Deoxyribosyltransferase n=1 Tax=Myoviridae sp. ctNnv6 TaxID=2825091 RepID=A0A8S5P465_9CAUD|nr:MAG TPA: deoxyribosyltransferase [Myoviridae sp. ctNnv6]